MNKEKFALSWPLGFSGSIPKPGYTLSDGQKNQLAKEKIQEADIPRLEAAVLGYLAMKNKIEQLGDLSDTKNNLNKLMILKALCVSIEGMLRDSSFKTYFLETAVKAYPRELVAKLKRDFNSSPNEMEIIEQLKLVSGVCTYANLKAGRYLKKDEYEVKIKHHKDGSGKIDFNGDVFDNNTKSSRTGARPKWAIRGFVATWLFPICERAEGKPIITKVNSNKKTSNRVSRVFKILLPDETIPESIINAFIDEKRKKK